MDLAIASILILLITFFLGSIPFGVIISRLFFKKDIRNEGSGNIGTTNAMRSLGKIGGGAVFILDFGKGLFSGFLGTVFAGMTAPLSGYEAGQLVLALSFFGCVVGHIYSPWLKFHGGKGIAVAIGALFFVFGPLFAVFELVIFAVLVVATRYVSVGSIAAALACPFFAFYLYWPNLPAACAISIEVCMWARKPEVAEAITNEHRNPRYLSNAALDPAITATAKLEEALAGAGAVVVVTPSRLLRDFAERMKEVVSAETPIIICSKGVEQETMLLPIEIYADVLGNEDRLAVLSGPNHAEEVVYRTPSGTVIASPSEQTALFFRGLFASTSFRCYVSSDYIGVELCAAFKNVIAIAVGIAYGMGMGDNTAAMLMTRGMAEMSRLVYARGGDPLTVMGLAGAGDLIATCTSQHSRNRTFGEYVAKGKTLEEYENETHMVVEGALACKTIEPLARSYGVELPITKAVRSVLWDKASIEETIMTLFDRPLTTEFWGLEHEGAIYAK